MKTKQLSLWMLLLALVPVLAFKTLSPAQDARIVVGVAYQDMNCNGLTVGTAKGYVYKTARGGSMSDLIDAVRYDAMKYYNVDRSDVVMKTGYQPYAVIISYEKKISGWGCSKKVYGVGFGRSRQEAEASAIRGKESSSAAHTVVKTISL